MKPVLLTTRLALATCLSGKTARSHILTVASALAMFLAQAALANDIPLEIAAAASISLSLPGESFVTIVIDDAEGNRVRNLVAEKKYSAGKQTLVWDGLDDAGKPVAPGNYKWRGLTRDELKLEYQFSVYNANAKPPWFTTAPSVATDSGWLSDHHPPCSVTTFGDKIFVGAIVSENGQDLMALDRDGNKLWGIAHPGNGAGASVLCADDKFVYGAGEAQWAGDNAYVYRVDPQTYKIEVLWHHKGRLGLRGIAARDGKIYVASDLQSKIFVVDANAKSGMDDPAKVLREITLPAPGGLAFSPAGKLLACSGQSVVVVNDDESTLPLISDHLTRPNRMAVGADGMIYISDGPTSWYRDDSIEANTLYGNESVRFSGDNQIKVFSADGKFQRAIGTAGGRKVGPYDSNAMRCPIGIALDGQNRLWVTEFDMLPKRLSVWNAQTDKLEKEFIGAPKYGGGGALDPGDKTQMIYDGMLFKLDWQSGAWKLTDTIVDIMQTRSDERHTFGGYADWPTRIVRYQGEQFFVGGKVGGDLADDGGTVWKRKGDTFLPIAHVGRFSPGFDKDGEPNTAHYLYQRMVSQVGDKPPGFGVGVDAGYPPNKWHGHVSYTMLWADANGDGSVQPEEANFSDKPMFWLSSASVGPDLSIYLRKVSHRLVMSLWRLPLSEMNSVGAPVYDISKIETVATDVPDLAGGSVVGMGSDGAGRLYTMSTPLRGFDPVSKTRWSYPNSWPSLGVGAPRAAPGLIVGGWGVRGATNYGGEIGGLMAVNSNFGQWYLFTGDGLFVSTLFGDVRTSPFWGTHFKEAKRGMNVNGVSVGQESFGGWMGKSSDGNVYIVAGHPHVSIVKVVGLDSVKRLPGGALEIDAAATSGASANANAARDLVLRPGANFRDDAPTTVIKSGEAEVARAWLGYDGNNLYARWKVLDASPLSNAGTDSKLLFKTGDSVDLQLGLDPNADVKRSTPAPGDIRLLLTKTKDGASGVLYRYKVAGTEKPERFWSPTGEVLVDKIEALDAKTLNLETEVSEDGYTLSATIPWKILAGAEYAPPVGGALRGDVGILFSDPAGATTVERVYQFNKNTNIVADVPSEIRLHPDAWGALKLGF